VEIRLIRTDHPKAPVIGASVYIIIEENAENVTLFHPFYLEDYSIPRAEYVLCRGSVLWPGNDLEDNVNYGKKIVQMIESRVEFFRSVKRKLPTRSVFRCLATLKGVPVSEIEKSDMGVEITSSLDPKSREVVQYELAKKLTNAALEKFKRSPRTMEILGVLQKGPATVTGISSVIKYAPKLKVSGQDLAKAKEREILWVIRETLIPKGIVKVKGESQ
jgi:hypothetical protein